MAEKRTHINVGTTLTIPEGTEVGVFTDSACTVAATIYENDGTTPAANPVIVDANGEFSYRAANGTYFEKIGTEPAAEITFYDPPASASQAEAEAGTEAAIRSFSPLRIRQAIVAWWATISGNFLARVSGTATNLKETKQLVTTGVTTLAWGTHVEINYAGNIDLSTGGITDIPSDDTEAFMVITQHHLGALRSITWGETQPVGGLPTARGTTYTVYCLRPSAVVGNENKYFIECVGGR